VLAVAAAVALVGSGCTGDDSIDVVIDDGLGVTDRDTAAMDLAMDNGYASASRSLEGAPFDGLALDVEYFEPLRKGEWVAPERCTFSTRVSVNGELMSQGFNGPRNDDDREAGDGVLVATTNGVVSGDITDPAPSTAIDDRTEADPTTTIEAPAGTTVGEPDPNSETPVQDDGSSEDGSGEDGHSPGSGSRPALLALAVVHGHDQVVELSTEHPAVVPSNALEAQPLDGWNVLRVAFEPDADLGDTVPVTLRRIHSDGTETSEALDVPVGGSELTLLTEEWAFDLNGVDDTCRVPGGSIDNQPPEPRTDILGSPVGDAPDLPEPGVAPADPAAAADEALRSLRAMYDITDVYAASKRDHVENPDDWDAIRRELIADDIVGPYMSNLEPEFRSSVFISPTEAHILYRVGPSYQWEIGRVLLIDGRWRVAAGTLCRDLSAASYRCSGVINDPPPGPLG